MKFYTADTHYDHIKIVTLCYRPFNTLEDMQNELIARWNAKVTNSDDVYILGDFCFREASALDFISKINGTKHFITGNHDADVLKKLANMKTKITRGHMLRKCFFHGDIMEIKDNDTKIALCHYPIFEWYGSHRGTIHLHGHSHGKIGKSFKTNAYDVGVDVRNFEPVTLEEIINYQEKGLSDEKDN